MVKLGLFKIINKHVLAVVGVPAGQHDLLWLVPHQPLTILNESTILPSR